MGFPPKNGGIGVAATYPRCRIVVEKSAGPNKDHLAAQHGLGRRLIEEGVASPAQLREALAAAQSGGHILQHLVKAGHITVGDLHDFLSKQPGIAGIDISQYVIERGLAQLIPRELARERQVMPIDALGKLLTVAMACPVDTATIAEVESLTSRRVKAVLCRATDLMAAIEKQYPENEEAETKSAFDELNIPMSATTEAGGPARADIVEQLRALDSLPLTAATIQQCDSLWGQDAPSVVDVCDFVSEQPTIAAAALRAANAEAFGLRGQVGSITLACSILGAETIRAVALDAGRAAGTLDLDAHAREALLCAKVCAEVARACGHTEAGQLYTAGLLHGIGRVAFAQVEPDFYENTQDLGHAQIAAREIKRFGLSYAEAGFELLNAWGVPASLSGAIRDHLDPASSEAHRQAAALLACARSLTTAHLSGTANPALEAQSKHLFEIAGLESPMAESILSGIAGAA